MYRVAWLIGSLIVVAGVAHAETDRDRAEREIEQQMKQMVKAPPPPSVRVVWEGLDTDKVEIDDARFMLDDTRLSYGELDDLATSAAQHRALYDGPIDPGKHQLEITLSVHRTKVSLFEGLRRTTFKITSAVGFPGQPGLQVTLKVKLHYDEKQSDPKKRMQLLTREEPHMVVAVDDAPMPEPPHTVVATAKEEPAKEEPAKPEAAEPAPPQEKPARHKPSKREKHEKQATQLHRHAKVRLASAEREPPAPVAAVLHPAPTAAVGAEPLDAGSPKAAPIDAGSIDAGEIDAGEIDAGALDAGTNALAAAAVDAGAVTVAAESSSPSAIWFALAGVVLLGLAAVGLRRRKR